MPVAEKEKESPATDAMFMYACEINGSRRIPLGYILTNKLTAAEMRQLYSASMAKLSETGAHIINITFDGLKTNIAAAQALGANLDPLSDSFNPFLINLANGSKVMAFPDPIHMFKLLRNAWKHYKFFVDAKGRVKRWT